MKKIKYEQAKVLEDIIGKKWKKIPQVNEIEWDTKGVKVNDGEITGLGLFRNQLQTLPESIGNLKSLESLSLDKNQLSTLPESIGNLNSLKLLYLSDNNLVTLPESIYKLKSLESLSLDNNQLLNLIESIGNLESLKNLNLAYNNLKTLPDSMKNLKVLQKIELKGNPLNHQFKIMLKTADGSILRKIYEKQKLKLKKEGIEKESSIIEKLIQEKKFSNATLKLEDIKKTAKRYNLSEIVSWVDKKLDLCDKLEKTENLKKKFPLVEKLIREMKFSDAIRDLNDIKKKAERNHLGEILTWVERNLTLCNTYIIKKTVLELGIKFARLQIAEISEVCDIDDVQLIVNIVKDMIDNKEIYAQYFSSTKSVAFDQQANIDEIDKLMSTYIDWEEKKIGKK